MYVSYHAHLSAKIGLLPHKSESEFDFREAWENFFPPPQSSDLLWGTPQPSGQ